MIRIILILIVLSYNLHSQTYYQPLNLGFELGQVGETPAAWDMTNLSVKGGYEGFLNLTDPFEGKYHATLQKIIPKDAQLDSIAPAGALFQRIDALSYRGYKVRFRIALKNDFKEMGGSAHLFMHIKKDATDEGTFDIDFDNPLIADNWKYFYIETEVPMDANQIRFGVVLNGRGVIHIDDASFEIVQPTGYVNEPPHKISQLGIDNLYTLTKLYGYVRFFYPTELIKDLNWEQFMLKAVTETETIKDSTELAAKLLDLFSYPAPLLNIDLNNSSNLKAIDKPDEALDMYALGWMHSGAFAPRSTDHLYSKVHNIYNSLRPREASAFQVIEIHKYRNQIITVSADLMTASATEGSGAMIWLRADNDIKRMTAFRSSTKYPAEYPEWTNVTTEISIPNDAELLRIGAVFAGEGYGYFDNFKAFDEHGNVIELKNPGFEDNEPGPLDRGWIVPGNVLDAGYRANVQINTKTEGEKSLRFSSSIDDRIIFPKTGNIYTLKLNRGIFAHMPSVLYADSSGALPVSDITPDLSVPGKPAGYFANTQDRTSRLVIAMMAWSIIDNFSIRNFTDEQLFDIFSDLLTKSSEADDVEEFLEIIRELIYHTHDSQARVWYKEQYSVNALPFLIESIDDKLYVSKVHNSVSNQLESGYEILEINGEPAYDFISSISSKIPSTTNEWAILRAIALFRVGDEDTEEKFNFMDLNNNEIELNFRRNIRINELHHNRPEKAFEVDSTTIYLDLTSLTDRFFKNSISDLNYYDNFILDARGSVDVSTHTLGLFIESPILNVKWEIPVYTFPDKSIVSRKSVQGLIKAHNLLPNKKIIILTDKRSIGYTEAIIKIAQQYQIARIIGENTAGMPGDILPFRLPGFINFSMTVMRAYAPDESLFTGKPTTPDIIVKPTYDDLINNVDPILNKGLNYFIE